MERKLAAIFSTDVKGYSRLMGIELGREEEARAAAIEVLRRIPNFSVEAWGQSLPFKDPRPLERHLANLRQAGLE